MRKPKCSRNNSQSDLRDYASSTSSSVKLSDQIANPSCGHTTCMQHHSQPKLHLVGKNQRVDRQEYVYQDLVETSSVQFQNEKYLEDRKNQYIDMTCVPKRIYRQ